MKLDEFVKQTLLDITNGVAEAQTHSKLYIAPGYVESERQTTAQFVKFEVAVTFSKDGGGAISVWDFAQLKAGSSSEHTNRISFEVPVYFQAPTARNEMHFSRRNTKVEN